jgi:hypothetical protein
VVTLLPYIYRWERDGRKGTPCRILARSRRLGATVAGIVKFGQPAPKNFNSILIEFADGHRTITSGNAIRKAKP